MEKPVYGNYGRIAYWLDDATDTHRAHILRRYYDWHFIPSGNTGRTSALFLDDVAYTTTLEHWDQQLPSWRYSAFIAGAAQLIPTPPAEVKFGRFGIYATSSREIDLIDGNTYIQLFTMQDVFDLEKAVGYIHTWMRASEAAR